MGRSDRKRARKRELTTKLRNLFKVELIWLEIMLFFVGVYIRRVCKKVENHIHHLRVVREKHHLLMFGLCALAASAVVVVYFSFGVSFFRFLFFFLEIQFSFTLWFFIYVSTKRTERKIYRRKKIYNFFMCRFLFQLLFLIAHTRSLSHDVHKCP